jgi:hypothetical protein
MIEAPLHPRRVESTLLWLRRDGVKLLDTQQYETLVSALKLIRKGQRNVGLSAEVADVGSHVLGVLDYVKKGLTRR